MNKECFYCGNTDAVKDWVVTKEPVCLPCRLIFLADEFEGTASKKDCKQLRYYAELFETPAGEEADTDEL